MQLTSNVKGSFLLQDGELEITEKQRKIISFLALGILATQIITYLILSNIVENMYEVGAFFDGFSSAVS